MNEHECLRCGEVLRYDINSGEHLPSWKEGFGHMCHADNKLRCTTLKDPDFLTSRLNYYKGLVDIILEREHKLQKELAGLRSLGQEI